MKSVILGLSMFFCILHANVVLAGKDDIQFFPIEHASFIIQSETATIYVDPVGEPEKFSEYGPPDIILITHGHRDHFSRDTINRVKADDTLIICPKDLQRQLGKAKVLANGETFTDPEIKIEAVAAYNLTAARKKYHPKGLGNGYVVSIEGKRIYISGDTEDIPEMRALKNIDDAFVCMNLPYTMTVDQAVSAVNAFKPGVVFPYHYRGASGFSDIQKFKTEVEKSGAVKVVLLSWY